MAKQTGHVKAVGTVDDNVNFYYSELDGFLAMEVAHKILEKISNKNTLL